MTWRTLAVNGDRRARIPLGSRFGTFVLLAAASGLIAADDGSADDALIDATRYLGALPTNADKALGLQWLDDVEFAPALGENQPVEFALDAPGTVTLELHAPDGEVVRTLLAEASFEVGVHAPEWDGRDDAGAVVPDEAYVPVLHVRVDGGERVVDDPRRYSGGEIVADLPWTLRGDTELSFEVPAPARVLIRAGIEEGPMLRELRHWTPVSAGRAVVRWDGRDADGVDAFADRDDVWTVVMAYLLPEFTVIASGNDTIDYRDYRESRGWAMPVPDLSSAELQRDGVRLSPDHFLPRNYLPRVSLAFEGAPEISRVGIPVVGDVVRFRVDVPDEDRWILDSTFYETGFYVDYAFRSEEEQGFVPMVWELDTSALEPGRHVATVQLFGFGGFIASDTLEFLRRPD